MTCHSSCAAASAPKSRYHERRPPRIRCTRCTRGIGSWRRAMVLRLEAIGSCRRAAERAGAKMCLVVRLRSMFTIRGMHGDYPTGGGRVRQAVRRTTDFSRLVQSHTRGMMPSPVEDRHNLHIALSSDGSFFDQLSEWRPTTTCQAHTRACSRQHRPARPGAAQDVQGRPQSTG